MWMASYSSLLIILTWVFEMFWGLENRRSISDKSLSYILIIPESLSRAIEAFNNSLQHPVNSLSLSGLVRTFFLVAYLIILSGDKDIC